MKVGIVDVGVSNINSIAKAVAHLGYDVISIKNVQLTTDSYDRLIFPGVGNFCHVMRHLQKEGLDFFIRDYCEQGGSFLGICLGLQMLFTKSFEGGEVAGLDVVAGDVVRFASQPGLKVPHMGWNQLRIRRRSPLLADIPDGAFVYFVHSYYVVPRDKGVTATETDYPTPFTSSIWRDNIFATQFHPEKSQQVGLQLLRNFATL